MTRPYSEDIREWALARADAARRFVRLQRPTDQSLLCDEVEEGGGISEACRLARSAATRCGFCRMPTPTGCANAFAPGPFTSRKLMQELAARGINTDVRAVWTFVHPEGLRFKKTLLPAEQDRAKHRP